METSRNPDRPEGSIPRLHRVLAGLQMVLAITSVVLDLSGACGACEKSGGPRLEIALGGSAAYLGLFLLGWWEWRKAFYTGVFLAAGVHTALGAILILNRAACVPCLLSAVVAIAFAAHALLGGPVPVKRAKVAWPAAFLVTLAVLAPGLASARAHHHEEDRREAMRAPRGEADRASRPGIRLEVYEMARCPYCREFRETFLPRLAREFGDRVEVSFHDAARVPWIERAPTLVIEGGPVFDGLPLRYEHLRDALGEAIEKRVPREVQR